MYSEEKKIIIRVVENFIRTGAATDEQVAVTKLPPGKTSYVEQSGEYGRSIMFDEYRVGGRVVWAGFSARSQTVYLSPTS
ncbi:MAG TPA: hypothetical protein PK152_12140 [Anaerolineales bacterium]|jgi:hypothetical protein|nr:hypothetical protein [Anaerolineae bacterium]HRJ56939.1 hypothetical protein [Anaerolineales bacterium]HRK89875.1 hypothetical protein [Anaerolineales bacterium]